MNSLLRALQTWLAEPTPPAQSTPRVQAKRQYVPTPHASRRLPPIIVIRDPRPYWQERGWRQDGRNYQGNYQTRFGSWLGYVTVSPSGRVEVFIHNPPQVLERHPHWQCFQARDRGWFFVHPSSRLLDVSAGIIGVEKTITEAYEI